MLGSTDTKFGLAAITNSGVFFRPVIVLCLVFSAISPVWAEVELTIHSIPEPANLQINGVSRGSTPLKLLLSDNTILKIQLSSDQHPEMEYDYTAVQTETLIFDLASQALTTAEAYQAYVASNPPKVPETGSGVAEQAMAETAVPPVETQEPACECSDKTCVSQKPTILQEPEIGSIPIEIQSLNVKGNAKYRILIGADGLIKDVKIDTSSGSDQLDQWIKPKLEKTEWVPPKKNGDPLSCWRDLILEFDTATCKFVFPHIYE